MEAVATKVPVHIRWMIRRDLPEVVQIEKDCFGDYGWNEAAFLDSLRKRNCIGMVAELQEKVVAFFIYDLHKDSIIMVNMAVSPDYQRKKIGTQIIDKMKDKLVGEPHELPENRRPSEEGKFRTKIYYDIRESNLPAQLFFKSQGFKVIKIVKNKYDDNDAAYRFKYKREL